MNKIFEKVLADYKKGNKQFRQRILDKYGFKDEKDFLSFVGYKPEAIVEKIKIKTLKPKVYKSAKVDETVDYVIAFDTTGSMSSYIESVKKHVRELIPTLFKDTPNLKMKIIAFGDYCDCPNPEEFGNAYQESQFTDNQNKLIDFVNKAQNTGGGDSDEFYELVIKKIVEETPWRDGKRNVLFIGDCSPHPVGYRYGNVCVSNKIDYKEELRHAKNLNIQFDTLDITDNKFYEEVAKITGGVCMPFKNADKISNIIEATYAVRYNKDKFRSMSTTVTDSGDAELIGAYKSMSSLL